MVAHLPLVAAEESVAQFLSGQIEREGEGTIQFAEFLARQTANVVGEGRLGKADELVAMDRAVVLQAFINSYRDLGRQAVVNRVNGRASYGGKARVDERLTSNDDEYAGLLWVGA